MLEPSESELEKLPSLDELMEMIFVPKTIEALYEDDTNVHITAKIDEVGVDRPLLRKCPNCRASVEESEDDYHCDNCGYIFDEAKEGKAFTTLSHCPICNMGQQQFIRIN